MILDISGGSPLFPAADLRDGYLRADPRDEAAVLKAVLKARDLVGTFEKPRYVTFDDDLCAHARSRIVGCNRCLELCPTGRHHARLAIMSPSTPRSARAADSVLPCAQRVPPPMHCRPLTR